jgi:glutathione S-transferase
MIELYELAGGDEAFRFSPYCWRIRMALAHKGLEARFIPWRFTQKDMIAFSGQGAVPVLRDGDHVVWDSHRIAADLDARYPETPLLFEGPQARALCELIHHYTQMHVQMALLKMIMMDLYAALDPRDHAYFRTSREQRVGMSLEAFTLPEDEARRSVYAALAPFRQTLRSHAYLCGDGPAYGDYILFGALMWAKVVSPKVILERDDPVELWRQKMLDLFGSMARHAPALGA